MEIGKWQATGVTRYVSRSSGIVYLHTHLADSNEQLAEVVAEFIGRTMLAYIWDRGAVKPCRITLLDVSGTAAVFDFKGRRFVMDVWDVFGNDCTKILPGE